MWAMLEWHKISTHSPIHILALLGPFCFWVPLVWLLIDFMDLIMFYDFVWHCDTNECKYATQLSMLKLGERLGIFFWWFCKFFLWKLVLCAVMSCLLISHFWQRRRKKKRGVGGEIVDVDKERVMRLGSYETSDLICCVGSICWS